MFNKVHGIGINDAGYSVLTRENGVVVFRCPFYETWKGILLRCYDPKYHQRYPSYIGTTVSPEWLLFSNFRSWMITQDWKDKQIDKDLRCRGSKVYSEDTCIFVTRQINMLLSNAMSSKGDLPVGVKRKSSGNYSAAYSYQDRTITIGTYPTISKAGAAYLFAKSKLLADIANEQSDNILKTALLQHADSYNREAVTMLLEDK